MTGLELQRLSQIVEKALADPAYALFVGRDHLKAVKWLSRVAKIDVRAREDVLFYCRLYLGFEPTEYQKYFLLNCKQFTALRWSRQSGKTFIVAAYLSWLAFRHSNQWIAVISPSFRQSKQVIAKVKLFAIRLEGFGLIRKILKSKIEFINNSVIEAFPNNPDTIRGPTLNCIYWDEVNYTADDEDLYTAALFTLGTTSGQFVCSSTPGSADSIFYWMCYSEDFKDFLRHHVSWREAVEPNGPLKNILLEQIREQMRHDPWRWRREMEAEFSEDEGRWLSLELILSCQAKDTDNLEYHSFQREAVGEFYAGLDLGKFQDFSVLSIVDRKDGRLRLVHCHQFPHGTEYGSVIGHVKSICSRWKHVRAVWMDRTGLGEYVYEDMAKALPILTGVKLTVESKQGIAQSLRQAFVDNEALIPYDPELIEELHSEQFQLSKTGNYLFSHPEGSHDDRFWSLGLATAAASQTVKVKALVAFGNVTEKI